MVSLKSKALSPSSLPKKNYAKIPQVLDIPNLIQIQLASFDWLKTYGISELLNEISPVEDFSGERFELRFDSHEFQDCKFSEEECRIKEITFSAPLYVTVQLLVKSTGEVKEQKLFMGDIPLMTSTGTFVINGAERVVVSQLVRSPGAYFTTDAEPISGRGLTSAKLIPYRGAWMEFDTSPKNVISVKVDRKRKIPVTTLLRALGYSTEEEILELFKDVDTNLDHQYIKSTLQKDLGVTNTDEALIEFYRRLRPGEPPNLENARGLLQSLFFNPRRYDLGRVGRYKVNRRLSISTRTQERTLDPADIVLLIKMIIRINNGEVAADDIDHLGNRRVRAVGELIQNQLRVGLLRMERVVKERMSTQVDPATTTPAALINIRPVAAAVREFFGGSQLSQFMDQTNPLAELTHKRRLSALGPGGLSRDRAGFDVRDVHHSHYGRICPIETPEGPNIGLLGSLSTYARTNEYGFIETPYRKVIKELPNDYFDLAGRSTTKEIKDESGQVIVKAKGVITKTKAKIVSSLPKFMVSVKPFVSSDPNDITYLSADDEEMYIIAQANSPLDKKSQFATDQIETRLGETFSMEPPAHVEYMDVSPMQIVSVSTSLIPFLEHDDANRALMGSNMQRQAVPLLTPEAPLVGTGMEARVARDSGQILLSDVDGIVTSVTGDSITISTDDGENHHKRLVKFMRSNQGTCITQRAVVKKGDKIKIGDPLADSSSTDNGDLALGQNVLVAFMTWEGYNFEDAIIINESVVKNDKFTSLHIEKYEVEARETKLGAEDITRDIPNVGEESLRDLDEDGIIRLGAEVGPGDILVGKVTPKGETELTAEEKLLRAIFGEKARDVKDTSLRVPHGERGKVIGIRVSTRGSKGDLSPGVNKLVRVWIAQTRKLTEGDKMAGRHGNKGVVAKILPPEDMPFLPDGTPIDIVLNPIGVPSRMNLGQVLEAHLGLAAKELNFKALTPVFDGARDTLIEDALARVWILDMADAVDKKSLNGVPSIDWNKVKQWVEDRDSDIDQIFSDKFTGRARALCIKSWLDQFTELDASSLSEEELDKQALKLNREGKMAPPTFGKVMLRDGRTGEQFDQPVTIGNVYMMKLIHLVEDKIHARSTGPYSLITQQPLGGKAQFGGQRFGEMEVWALEAYSSAYNLQEMLTVKSDDVVGRLKTYEAIVKGENIIHPGVPESFHVLVKELQSLSLSVELLNEGNDEDGISEDDGLSDQETIFEDTGLMEITDELISTENATDTDEVPVASAEDATDTGDEAPVASTEDTTDTDEAPVASAEDATDTDEAPVASTEDTTDTDEAPVASTEDTTDTDKA